MTKDETLDFAFYIDSTPTFYITICISTLPTQNTTFIKVTCVCYPHLTQKKRSGLQRNLILMHLKETILPKYCTKYRIYLQNLYSHCAPYIHHSITIFGEWCYIDFSSKSTFVYMTESPIWKPEQNFVKQNS